MGGGSIAENESKGVRPIGKGLHIAFLHGGNGAARHDGVVGALRQRDAVTLQGCKIGKGAIGNHHKIAAAIVGTAAGGGVGYLARRDVTKTLNRNPFARNHYNSWDPHNRSRSAGASHGVWGNAISNCKPDVYRPALFAKRGPQ